jgi:hypothetical protein
VGAVSGAATDLVGPRRVAQLGFALAGEISVHAASRRSSGAGQAVSARVRLRGAARGASLDPVHLEDDDALAVDIGQVDDHQPVCLMGHEELESTALAIEYDLGDWHGDIVRS